MKKIIIIIAMIFTASVFADQEYTWKRAQEFNNTVLKNIDYRFSNPCSINGVYSSWFSVSCEPENLIYSLPYTWGGWKIVKTAPGLVIYSLQQ